MAEILEGTDAYNKHHAYVTGQIPITVHDGGDGMTPDMVTKPKTVAIVGAAEHEVDSVESFATAVEEIHKNPIPAPKNGAAMDPFSDDTPLACGIENPDQCESCT